MVMVMRMIGGDGGDGDYGEGVMLVIMMMRVVVMMMIVVMIMMVMMVMVMMMMLLMMMMMCCPQIQRILVFFFVIIVRGRAARGWSVTRVPTGAATASSRRLRGRRRPAHHQHGLRKARPSS